MANVSNRQFVTTWQKADSVNAAAEALGMKPATASSRARRLRKAGVDLKKMSRGPEAIDVSGLNELIMELETAPTQEEAE